MIKNSKMADFALMVTAIIWGTGFIGTQFAIDTGAKSSLITAMRFVLAGLILLVVYFKDIKNIDKKTLKVGITAGIILFFGFYIQTLGQTYTTVANSSFLTSTSVVMIPFIMWFATKKKPDTKIFILTFTTLIGIGVLTLDFSQGMSFAIGDVGVLISALCFAFHISYLGLHTKGLNTKQLTFLQMMTAGVVAFIFMLLFDRSAFDISIATKAFVPILYLAIFPSCICYYLQTTAQKYATASKTGIFLSTEGLFGSIFSVIIGFDALTSKLFFGGVIIMASVILSEVDFKRK